MLPARSRTTLPHASRKNARASGLRIRASAQETWAFATQQAALTASRQDLSQQMKTLILEGQRVMAVLRVSLKDHYGPRSEKLAEFGLQPFRGRKPKAKPEPEPGTETPGPVTPTADR
jgi:hypothetical protein